MTTQRLLAATALGLFLVAPGLAKAQFDFTTIDVPGAASTAVNGNCPNAIAGEFNDADGNTHGFVLSKGAYATIDVPTADHTRLAHDLRSDLREEVTHEAPVE